MGEDRKSLCISLGIGGAGLLVAGAAGVATVLSLDGAHPVLLYVGFFGMFAGVALLVVSLLIWRRSHKQVTSEPGEHGYLAVDSDTRAGFIPHGWSGERLDYEPALVDFGLYDERGKLVLDLREGYINWVESERQWNYYIPAKYIQQKHRGRVWTLQVVWRLRDGTQGRHDLAFLVGVKMGKDARVVP